MRLSGSRRAAALGAIAFMVAVGAYSVVGIASSGGASGDAPPRVLGPGPVTVRLVVRDSHFSPSRITVRPHTELTFEIANRDFLNHEFIIGDAEVHARHEGGHEAYHPPIPGEVSIPPHQTGVTTYAVHAPGKVLFACHLPGHFAYGMKGYVIVEA
jgi:uncharacterized cupredoxin-like copper-binding protein